LFAGVFALLQCWHTTLSKGVLLFSELKQRQKYSATEQLTGLQGKLRVQ
jgi:hypothetical protein